ncbi:hypothetical protein Y1Q_0016130 [Alligator mississippiensis]|uniref:Uncharacterized protein n=1 Tax=Alligator mississippiensis TaxID=8496 RepID=A0A151NBZ9_ALLMI|nr:hypothetical protein Y1Q_0016130 [Alligator mississippiensis]
MIGASLGILVAAGAATATAFYCWRRRKGGKPSYNVSELQGSEQCLLGQELELSRIQVLLHWDPLEEVPFAVHLDSFFPRRIHCIKWNWDGEGAGREESPNISPNLDGIFMVTGIWRVPCRRLTCLDLQVQVSVQHSPGDPQWRESFTWGTLAPEVSEISKSESDSADYSINPGMAFLAPDGKSFQQETRLTITHAKIKDLDHECICQTAIQAVQKWPSCPSCRFWSPDSW